MKTPLFAVAFAVAFAVGLAAQNAGAADLPTLKSPTFQPPSDTYSWTGFYVDGNAGSGWADLTGRLLPNFPPVFGAPVAVAAGVIPTNLNVAPNGSVGGGGLGYRWQTGSLVLGAETDFQASLITGFEYHCVPRRERHRSLADAGE